MKYVIMAGGEGKRWSNYLGIPKHLVKINGETLLARMTRLLKENGITNYVITGSDKRYKEYGQLIPQTKHDCEIDRFEESCIDGPVCYLYGDVYYSDDAMKTIVSTETDGIQFFGSNLEIFAIKITDTETFFKHKAKVKKLFLKGEASRCIGWEVYRSIHNIPLIHHQIADDYILIQDETDDIDYPQDYLAFKERIEQNVRDCISVIIPCCNRAKATKELIDELLYQKHNYYPETEIIAVENNSTEDMSFLDEYKDIIVKHESITGLPHARNVGLDIAHGQYIAFIDNDDKISRDYLNELYVVMRSTNCDWCLMPYKMDDYIKIYDEVPKDPLKVQWGSPWYCYNRRIIGDKRYNENLIVGEDLDWMPRVITPGTKGAIIKNPIYTYTWEGNEDSLCHRFNRGELKREKESV